MKRTKKPTIAELREREVYHLARYKNPDPTPADLDEARRNIDAWNSPEGWTWNTSYLMGTMTTSAENISKAMSRYLKQHHGIIFKANRTRTETDGSVFEIIDRKTKEPLFAAIPLF